MLRPRLIPCLLVQNGGLVKTVQFKDPKYVGDPINAVKIFNEKEADELIVLDIDATAKGNEPNYRQIAFFAAECRMPLCYGGGVRSAEQARRIISLGVEKVAISAAAIENSKLVSEVAEEIGRQSVAVVLDIKKRFLGRGYDVWTHNGTRNTKKDFIELASEMERQGAGEIICNSIDNDGVMKGYNVDAAVKLRESVKMPITVMGGAGNLLDIGQVYNTCGVVGAGVGSLFVFKGPYKAVLINYPSQKQKDELFLTSLKKEILE